MIPVRYAAASLLLSTLLLSPLALAATPPAATPKAPTQAGSGPPPLTKLAITGQGYIKEKIRTAVRDKDAILQVNWPYMAGGPHFCSFYGLGKQNVDPSQYMSIIKTRPDAVVQMLDIDEEAPDVAKGSLYHPHQLGYKPTLVVTADSPCAFMLQDSARVKPGSVTYGAFQDGSGELWIYEESIGPYFTDTHQFVGLHNDQMMTSLMKYYQAILQIYLDIHPAASGGGGGGPCPAKYASNYEVGVNHHVDSAIKVTKGDKISIRASGEVTFGIMAGSGGPEGIDFLPSYNYFENLKHGCLIGRVAASEDDPWSYIGASADFTADRSGELQFNVNDNDPDNNVGEFDVKITVCKGH